ncbi:MAG: SDR family oxidoreductase [Thermoleophilia bacterium]|nr:SDR family oxidoreductase [Thermoleophilia bacterium]
MGLQDIFGLDGKIALVTGAASGLGMVFAEAMAECGADVVVSDIDTEGLKTTTAKVEALGRKTLALRCDVTNEDEVARMVDQTVAAFGRIDILFNNAGVADKEPKRLHELTTEEWRRVLDVDLNGVFYCAREVLKVMVRQRSGKVINIASIWGLAGSSSLMPIPVYNTAKGAVVNLTRELGLEYAPLGINVNAICPGFFVTRISDGAFDDPEFVRTVSDFAPIGRPAAAAELKGTAIFLASSASDYMCGSLLVNDGGILAK